MKTAVLLLAFNRLDYIKETLAAIARAKPPRIYIACDGPRKNKPGEKETVNQVREYILSHIDWDCQVKTRFLKTNSGGCANGVSGAVTWFFENEPCGIILEDDCVPNLSFFYFCEELLKKYRDDKRIWHISGDAPIDVEIPESYYFAKIEHCWGWATWADRWKHFTMDLSNYGDTEIKKFSRNIHVQNYWHNILSKMKNHEIDSWAYPWTFNIIAHDGLCINPKHNLIKNIGNIGVHYNNSATELNNSTTELKEIIHPKTIKLNNNFVIDIYNKRFGIKYYIKNTFKTNTGYKCDFPVDLVILWCDDTPEFRSKREFWQKKLRIEIDKNIISERFKTIDELKYLLRSVDMYAPWINHIFIVTDNQCPKWLRTDNPKITIVDHSDIILPKSALPTFNSVAIEACIHKIPGLSEHFLYANDDTLFAQPVTPEFFFDEKSNPITRFNKDFLFTDNNHSRQVLYSYDVIENKHDIRFDKKYHLHHNIDAYRKSYYAKTVKEFSKEFKNTISHRFRQDSDLQRTIISINDILNNHTTVKILSLDNTDSFVFWEHTYYYKCKLICVNKSTYDNHMFLEAYYPKPSQFEYAKMHKKIDTYHRRNRYYLFKIIPILEIKEI